MIRSGKHHLDAAGESYFVHLRTALGFSASLAKASLACAIHALLPGLFTHSASRSIVDLSSRLSRRAALPVAARRDAPTSAQAHDGRDDLRFRIDV
ncbi:MAG TPA: DUF6356 family protein [Sphingomicrobium sp.]|jgi:hypothetical protein|nr:DUF6356 family protein [Sphingomicrobium sp.]